VTEAKFHPCKIADKFKVWKFLSLRFYTAEDEYLMKLNLLAQRNVVITKTKEAQLILHEASALPTLLH
jgi:hypothetical protein